MYVTQSNACNMPNSASPVTPAQISAQSSRMMKLLTAMDDGKADMAQLVNGMTPPVPSGSCDDLLNSGAEFSKVYPWVAPFAGAGAAASQNGPGANVSVTSGAAALNSPASSTASAIPSTSGASVVTGATTSAGSPTPSGSTAVSSPAGGQARRRGWGRGGNNRGPQFSAGAGYGSASQANPQPGRGLRIRNTNYPQGRIVSNLLNGQVSNFQCAAKVIPVPVVSTPAPAGTAPAPIVAAPPVSAPPVNTCPGQAACRTGNVCLDLRRGCVDSSQVSSEQLFACSEAGYAGNEGYFPCAIAPGQNLPYLGTPLPNPPPYSSVAAQDTPPPSSQNWGLAGLGCGDGCGVTSVLGIALGVAAGIFLADYMSKRNWSFAS